MVGEISFRGYEVIDNNDSSYNCPVQIIVNGTTTNLTGTPVTYTSTLTPFLRTITPRYGRVTGGEVVTFAGDNFSNDITQYSILIDGRKCDI